MRSNAVFRFWTCCFISKLEGFKGQISKYLIPCKNLGRVAEIFGSEQSSPSSLKVEVLGSDKFLRFEATSRQRRVVSKIEATFRTS